MKQALLDIICCPKCKADLRYDEKSSTLTCVSCNAVYQVKNNIPILLPENNGK